jgi:hypothetical protein
MGPHSDRDQESSASAPESDTEPITEARDSSDAEAPAAEPAPVVPEIIFPEDEQPPRQTPEADFSTVGTGSVFAISCSLLTILIILGCIGFFILTRLF